MSSAGRRIVFPRQSHRTETAARVIYGAILVLGASAVLFWGISAAHGGPCTDQIAQFEQQIGHNQPGPANGPTAPQSLGAQLHHQPTPSSVGQAEQVANKDGDAALDRAKKADAAGDAAGCKKALTEARRLYEINQ
jgi:hypothetical protein